MVRFSIWHWKRGHASSAAVRAGAPSRRLRFERCEPRIALSTTSAGDSEAGFLGFFPPPSPSEGDTVAKHDAVREGGSIPLEVQRSLTAQFASGFFQLQISQNAFAGNDFVRLFESEGRLRFDGTTAMASAVDSIFIGDTAATITENAFSGSEGFGDLDGSPSFAEEVGQATSPTAPELATAPPSSARILPISPLPHPGSRDDAGQIAMTAFSGGSLLGGPSLAPNARVAAARELPARPATEFNTSPQPTPAVDGLRGRAIVYEVAQAKHAAAWQQASLTNPLMTAALSVPGRTATGRPGSAGAAADDLPPAGHESASAARQLSAAPFAVGELAGERHAQAPVELQIEHGELPPATAEARDDAFAALDDEPAPHSVGDFRQRQAAGVAAILVLGVGPVGKLLRCDRQSLVEQLPPRRMQ